MTAATRRAKDRLRRFIESHGPCDGELPLVHITRAYLFDDIVATGCLNPQPCDVFAEPLIYMFYGRPAYRAKDGNNARLEFEWPIIFLFDPNKLQPIKRVFPFDTGAFALGLFKGFFDKLSVVEDFELPPNIDSAKRIVTAYYRDHDEYYVGLSRKNVEIPPQQFEAQGLHELARLPGMQSRDAVDTIRDERSSAIEVQFDFVVELADKLLAVILPEPYLDIPEIVRCLDEWRVPEILTYPTLHNLSGDVWVGQIYTKVYEFYKKTGRLK